MRTPLWSSSSYHTQFSLGQGPHAHCCARAPLALHWGSVVGMDIKTREYPLSRWVGFCPWIPVKAVGSCFWDQSDLSWEWIGADDDDELSFSPLLLFSLFINPLSLIILLEKEGKKGTGNPGLKQTEWWTELKWDSTVVYIPCRFSSFLHYSARE